MKRTRGDQKVLQFSMMYKWHRQNDDIIFNVHQYIFDICQKVLLFQSNRIPGACCRDTIPWPATAHHHQKTSFREGAASDVEIGRRRWVPGRVSKVGETTAQIRCPWLWPVQLETCAPVHYRAATADLGSAFPSASPSLPDADLPELHPSMVQSLSSVVGNPLAARLRNPRKFWPWLSSQRWVRNFLGGGELTCFHCIVSCLVSESQWWIHVSSPVIIRDNTLSGVAL